MKQGNTTNTISQTPALHSVGPLGWAALSVNKATASALTLILCGALTALADDNRAPDVPTESGIAVPAGNKVHFHGFGVGVQIYTWNGTSWGSPVPEATLFDGEGVVATHFGIFVANHFVGPAWQSNSGSIVVGALPPIAFTVDRDAIPWLRLNAVPDSLQGPGIFAETTFIQRVNTTGGKAPLASGDFIGQVARVPYTADYFFYRQSND